uniref:Uncharacterized protein n=1 Tax=Arundo donax TaxID=35708 RepID=A0A0A8ZSJ9_ARUDO
MDAKPAELLGAADAAPCQKAMTTMNLFTPLPQKGTASLVDRLDHPAWNI